MSEGFDLGQFLEQARAEGDQDSEGSFTIAQDKALDKLAHFSLPGEYDWVLKVVQSANSWACPVLQISQTRVATSFYFKPADSQFPTDAAIVNALRHGSLESNDPVHDLCVALRALVDQVKLSFVLAIRFQGKLGEPIYSGDDVTSLSQGERRRWSHLDDDGLRLTVSHFKGQESFSGRYIPTLSRVARRNLEIIRILEKRAFCSPTPIVLDGREITNPFRHRSLGNDLYYRTLAIGHLNRDTQGRELTWHSYPVLSEVENCHRPKELGGQNTAWCLLQTFDWMALQDYRQAMSHSTGSLSLPFFRSTPHQVFWVRHGVVCKRRTIYNGTLATTAFLILPSSHLRTDLTGLAVAEEEEGVQLSELLQEAVQNSLKPLLQEIPHLSRTVAVDAPIALQERPEIKTMRDLDAGFSIFTEGLRVKSDFAQSLAKKLHRSWRNFRGLPARKALLEEWGKFVNNELQTLQKDLHKHAKEAISDF